MRAAAVALLGLAFALLWQWATVAVNYRGNWSALFCTGALRGVPPSLAGERIYQFRGSTGYDGQAYHYIAHDPFLRNPELTSFVDEPRLRYRRILVPVLAWVLALGRGERIDGAYRLVCALAIGLGVFWSARLCRCHGRPCVWGLLFLLLPAVLVGIDRLVADVALAALTAAFALNAERRGWRLWLVLAAAALVRETGLLLVAGTCGCYLLRREWRPAVWAALAAVPAALWYGYVQLHTAPYSYGAGFIPGSAIASALLHPPPYPAGTSAVLVLQVADELALAGVVLAFALGLWLVPGRRCTEPGCLAALGFAAAGILLQRTDHWLHVFDFGRVYSPLLVLLAVEGLKGARRPPSAWWWLPWAAMVPRAGMQFAPQLLNVARAVFRA